MPSIKQYVHQKHHSSSILKLQEPKIRLFFETCEHKKEFVHIEPSKRGGLIGFMCKTH